MKTIVAAHPECGDISRGENHVAKNWSVGEKPTRRIFSFLLCVVLRLTPSFAQVASLPIR
jgi:hypothetical protein